MRPRRRGPHNNEVDGQGFVDVALFTWETGLQYGMTFEPRTYNLPGVRLIHLLVRDLQLWRSHDLMV